MLVRKSLFIPLTDKLFKHEVVEDEVVVAFGRMAAVGVNLYADLGIGGFAELVGEGLDRFAVGVVLEGNLLRVAPFAGAELAP